MDEKVLVKGEFKKGAFFLWFLIAFVSCLLLSVFGAYDLRSLHSWIVIIPASVVAGLIGLIAHIGDALTVTTYRVYGCRSFKRQIDLPLSQISAVGRAALGGIAIGSSSGKIIFRFVKNNVEVMNVISELLQDYKPQSVSVINQTALSNAEEIKKFKELLDEGVITAEEFETKKKELLK